MSKLEGLDLEIRKLVMTHGLPDVLAAFCRYSTEHGYTVLFRKLNRVYEWLTE